MWLKRPGAIEGFAIGAVGHALFADIALDGLEAAGDVIGAEPGHLVEEFQPMAARAPVRGDELVRHALERPIGGRHLDQAPCLGACGVLRRGSQWCPLRLNILWRETARFSKVVVAAQ